MPHSLPSLHPRGRPPGLVYPQRADTPRHLSNLHEPDRPLSLPRLLHPKPTQALCPSSPLRLLQRLGPSGLDTNDQKATRQSRNALPNDPTTTRNTPMPRPNHHRPNMAPRHRPRYWPIPTTLPSLRNMRAKGPHLDATSPRHIPPQSRTIRASLRLRHEQPTFRPIHRPTR